MERPERPSRHKINRGRFPYCPSISSDSESELNDSDGHITYYRDQVPHSGGPSSTQTSNQRGSGGNLEAAGEDELSTQTDIMRRKRTSATVFFNNVDSLNNLSSSVQRADTPDRPHRSDFVIRPRSFCRMDNSPSIFKYKRQNGPMDLAPNNRESLSQAPGTSNSLFSNDNYYSSSVADVWDQPHCYNKSRGSSAPTIFSTSRREYPVTTTHSSSSILRHFDELTPSPVIRRTLKSSCSARRSDSSGRDGENSGSHYNSTSVNHSIRSTPQRTTTPQPSNFPVTVIGRYIEETPGLINQESTPYTEPQQPPDPVPMEHANDDVIVLGTPDSLPSTSSFVVPLSRSPSPVIVLPPATGRKQDKTLANPSKEVPMTLQELNQSLVSLLECPVCLDHATPPIYQCCKGHILCQGCHPRLNNCPICRCRLPGDRNSVMEKVAEKLMYPCKNTVTGCSQMLKLVDKQGHEEGCGFRHYACIISACHWKGYKPELIVHIQRNHPDKLITGAVKELHVPVTMIENSLVITHHWIQFAHTEVFNVIFHIDLYKRVMKGCVVYIGSPERAVKFSYLFELKQREAPFRKLSYSRMTHADTFMQNQPMCLSNDFSINIDMAQLYHDGNSNSIPVHISILEEQ